MRRTVSVLLILGLLLGLGGMGAAMNGNENPWGVQRASTMATADQSYHLWQDAFLACNVFGTCDRFGAAVADAVR